MRHLNPLLLLLLMSCVPRLPAKQCIQVGGDRIRAGDVARVAPPFRKISPETMLGYAPAPGLQRVFTAAQLNRMLRQHGVTGEIAGRVCFERMAERLNEERLLAVLRKALEEPEAELELVDYSRQPVPEGTLVFRLAGLRIPVGANTETPLLWRGTLEYGERHSLPVWAKVRIRIKREEMVATRDLAPGNPIGLTDVEIRVVESLPREEPAIQKAADVVGSMPRRRISAGESLRDSLLIWPNDVNRGEVVHVEVTNGATRLQFEAKAASGGHRGDRIQVVNPTNGKRFSAVVEGKGEVVVRHPLRGGNS